MYEAMYLNYVVLIKNKGFKCSCIRRHNHETGNNYIKYVFYSLFDAQLSVNLDRRKTSYRNKQQRVIQKALEAPFK